MKITASDLYSYVSCPHRIYRDAFDDQSLKDPPNDFVKLLWEQGFLYERKVIEEQKGEIEILDLSQVPVEGRLAKTIDAMRNRVPYIYQGHIAFDDLLGRPDLLELQANGEYMPVDIKSGMGYKEGGSDEEEPKLKKTYAVQLGLYIDVLIQLGFATGHVGKIWDSKGQIIEYDLDLPQGVRNKQTWWELYQQILFNVRDILKGQIKTESALGSVCKMCEWYTDCKKQCISNDDISLISQVGRALKEDFMPIAKTVAELAKIKPENYINSKGKTDYPGIGEKTLIKMHRRAKLLANKEKEPIFLAPFTLPEKPIELYFDIETDPTQDILYLHGVIERRKGQKGVFHSFVAKDVSKEEEKKAWNEFWAYIRSLPQDQWAMYYYSKYERTQYRSLANRYPDVATKEQVEWLFDPSRSIDLYYDIVLKCTDWPTYNYSVKTLAQHLGFSWRDENPSGAASIQWFNEYCQTKSQLVLQRILDYNEDDCWAMVVLKDKLSDLSH